MSLTYKFDKEKSGSAESLVDKVNSQNVSGDDRYQSIGPFRNICFVFRNGDRTFLSYSCLICGEFIVNESEMIFSFTDRVVKLCGINLEELFTDFLNQQAYIVQEIDDRYMSNVDNKQSIVNKIIITKPK